MKCSIFHLGQQLVQLVVGGREERIGQSLGACQNPSDKLSTQGPQAMLLGRKLGRGGWSIAAEPPDVTLYIMSLSRQRVQSPLVSPSWRSCFNILLVHMQLL